jgi:hypothetical protein
VPTLVSPASKRGFYARECGLLTAEWRHKMRATDTPWDVEVLLHGAISRASICCRRPSVQGTISAYDY